MRTRLPTTDEINYRGGRDRSASMHDCLVGTGSEKDAVSRRSAALQLTAQATTIGYLSPMEFERTAGFASLRAIKPVQAK
jgi:hypothetical protein